MIEPTQSGVNALGEIDRVLHEPARMQICALLYVLESADYTFVMNQTGLTWGNLSAHLSKLESAGYVKIEKTFQGKRPRTNIMLSDTGRIAFKGYVTRMKALFDSIAV